MAGWAGRIRPESYTPHSGGLQMKAYYIGLDIHKKTISYCVKIQDGTIIDQGKIQATRQSLSEWLLTLPNPRIFAMEATIFTSWIYDYLKPHALDVQVAHPQMLKAITEAKKKNDAKDAEAITDLLRCNLLPQCHMIKRETRDLRRVLRYRNMLVRECVRMNNKMGGILMETGTPYNKRKLRTKKYMNEVLDSVEYLPQSARELLLLSKAGYDWFNKAQKRLVSALRNNTRISQRVELLMTIPGVGEITALTWVLEIDDPHRFSSVKKAVSYCGLCSAQIESAGKQRRSPISKKRNKHLQTILIEAAKIAPLWNPELAEVYAREAEKGNRNQASIAVARKIVAYLLAVDKRKESFKSAAEKKAA